MTRHTRRTRERADCGAARKARERLGIAGALVSLLSVVFALTRFASWADGREGSKNPPERPPAEDPAGCDDPLAADSKPETEAKRHVSTRARARAGRRSPLRLAGAFALALVFFAGASLAAVAGDAVVTYVGDTDTSPACADSSSPPSDEDGDEVSEPSCVPTTTDETTTDDTPAGDDDATDPVSTEPETPAEAAPPEAFPPATPAPSGGSNDSATPAPAPTAPAQPAAGSPPKGGRSAGPAETAAPVVDEARPASAPLALEVDSPSGVVWLHRDLADPIPALKRLSPAFARRLLRASQEAEVSWALVLAVVRVEGGNGSVPAGTAELRRVARRLASAAAERGTRRPWLTALAYSGDTAFADRVVAFARLNRAIGLRGLVVGLKAAKPRLIERVLADRKIEVYDGGRADIDAGRVDVRVLVLLRYLRLAHGGVTVSSLISGHRTFARRGVVSAHVYGLAVDIAALGGTPIVGNQEPNGLTERAVRSILMLPRELAPQQVISLLALGGSSFALADHGDHIHAGY